MPLNLVDSSLESKILFNIKPNSKILEFGPANGRFTRYLKETLFCDVYIVEYDENSFKEAIRFAKDGICDDAMNLSWLDKFFSIEFDYVLFIDALEHLFDPANVLRNAVTLLKSKGSIFISAPNMAHSSIIIDLINNKFEYRPLGLLDDTHIRFFTYNSLKEILNCSGLTAICEDATYLSPEQTEMKNDYTDVSGNTDVLKSKDYENVYQFVFQAIRTEYYLEKNIDISSNIKKIQQSIAGMSI